MRRPSTTRLAVAAAAVALVAGGAVAGAAVLDDEPRRPPRDVAGRRRAGVPGGGAPAGLTAELAPDHAARRHRRARGRERHPGRRDGPHRRRRRRPGAPRRRDRARRDAHRLRRRPADRLRRPDQHGLPPRRAGLAAGAGRSGRRRRGRRRSGRCRRGPAGARGDRARHRRADDAGPAERPRPGQRGGPAGVPAAGLAAARRGPARRPGARLGRGARRAAARGAVRGGQGRAGRGPRRHVDRLRAGGALRPGRSTPPAGTREVDLADELGTWSATADEHFGGPAVEGLEAVRAAVPFELRAPDALVGLPRGTVRLLGNGRAASALTLYGRGLGQVVVWQEPASAPDTLAGRHRAPPAGRHRRRGRLGARHGARHRDPGREGRRALHARGLGSGGGGRGGRARAPALTRPAARPGASRVPCRGWHRPTTRRGCGRGWARR